jgi:hypothetical protein
MVVGLVEVVGTDITKVEGMAVLIMEALQTVMTQETVMDLEDEDMGHQTMETRAMETRDMATGDTGRVETHTKHTNPAP